MREKTLRVVAHYAIVDNMKVEIDPVKTNLPDRCKIAMAEILTGQKYELKET